MWGCYWMGQWTLWERTWKGQGMWYLPRTISWSASPLSLGRQWSKSSWKPLLKHMKEKNVIWNSQHGLLKGKIVFNQSDSLLTGLQSSIHSIDKSRGWSWSQFCLTFSFGGLGNRVGCALSKFADAKNWEEWLTGQMVVLPFKETKTGWRNEQTNLGSSAERNEMPSVPLCASTEVSLLSAGGWTEWSQETSSHDSWFTNLIFSSILNKTFIEEFSNDTSYLINSDVKNPEVHFLSFQ